MYAIENFKTKKAFLQAIKDGKKLTIWSPGPFPAPTSGKTTIEGPWFPEPHKWYAEAHLDNGIIIAAK